MLVFVASDKGGTGRSVTSSNVAFRSALRGRSACYLDFDFVSPTSGSIFDAPDYVRGAPQGGLHAYLEGGSPEPLKVNLWTASEASGLRERPAGAEKLVLMPGSLGGSDFPRTKEKVSRCVELFLSVEEQFELSIIDLSAGRSYAVDIALEAAAQAPLKNVTMRWLVFHRWTHQHILAASNLASAIIDVGVAAHRHNRVELTRSLRFVRTAVIGLDDLPSEGLRSSQLSFLNKYNDKLIELADRFNVGDTRMLGAVPMDPLLQWREQLISDDDVWDLGIANERTVTAFEAIATDLFDEQAWGTV
jgi:hypothetical protein